MQKWSRMRDRMLHDSLRALTDDAARLLEDLLVTGAEIPFEVGEAGRSEDQAPGMRGAVTMFAYRPLTSEFVSAHADQLRQLPTFESAAQNLARTRGVVAYLRVQDEPVLDVGELTHARLGVLAFLSAVWHDAERFEHWSDRFERAYSELESIVLAERMVSTVHIPVHGVALSEGSLNLGSGVELVAVEELDQTCLERFSDQAGSADSFCTVSVTAPSDAPTPMPAVRQAARALLTALRLFRPGSVALGMTAQAEMAGSWHQVSMPFSGRSREDAWLLAPEDEEELRQFVAAVRRVERRTRVAWALRRFETGLERTVPAEGLTDFLLALRALLESSDDRGRAALPVRVAALCAQDHERQSVRDEIEAAFALERLAVDGHVGRADRKRLEKLPPLETIAAVERHLRALLHDLVCGYLSTDLKALADEILSADGEQPENEAVVEDPVYLEPVPNPDEPPPPDPTQTVEFDAVFDDTAEIKAIDLREDVAAFYQSEPVEQPSAEVWQLRPAAEIAPPPISHDPISNDAASQEPISHDPAPTAYAVETSEPALQPLQPSEPEPAVEGLLPGVPDWEASPERRPVGERPEQVQGELAGFTFDFEPLAELPPQPEQSQPVSPQDRSLEPLDESVPAFPIPEFGVPTGPGPAVLGSDREVAADEQRASLREIMNPDFRHPVREADEPVSTAAARDAGSHLSMVEGPTPAMQPPEPRITAPEAAQPDLPVAPTVPVDESPQTDPNLTVEYDVLGAEPSAEESAQLAWSEQFVRREDLVEPASAEPALSEPTTPEPTTPEPIPVQPELTEPALPEPAMTEPVHVEPTPTADPADDVAPRLLDPVGPTPDLVLAKFPEPAEKVEPPAHGDDVGRNRSIGPATIEFRPLIDADPDDPDDFSGAC